MNKCTIQFFHKSNILEGVELEQKQNHSKDLSEGWLERKTHEYTPKKTGEYTVVYLDFTPKEWEELGIKESLWGQSQTVNGKIICYGRWYDDSDYQQSQHYPEPIHSMAEVTLGLAHEILHGLYHLKGRYDLTHYYAYGYKDKYAGDDQDRYARTPNIMDAFKDVLDGDDEVNIYAIRTEALTKRWKDDIEDVKKLIAPKRMEKIRSLKNRIASLTKKASRLAIEYAKSLLPSLTKRVNALLNREKKTPSQRVYEEAVKALGTDVTPGDKVSDEVACAISVCTILKRAKVKINPTAGTWVLWNALKHSQAFLSIEEPEPGAVIISPTGTAPEATIRGHVAIVGKNHTIMANVSATGLWSESYTVDSWKERWGKAGFPIYYFRPM